METISFTIPNTYSALSRTGNMLLELAEDAASEEQHERRPATVTMDGTANTGDGSVKGPTPSVFAESDAKGDGVTDDAPAINRANAVAVPKTTPQEHGAVPDAAQDGHVDSNGVPFDAAFCSSGDAPFYTSGPKLGQWKKKRGVDEAQYEEWYAERLTATREGGTTPVEGHVDEPAQTNTAAAFGGQTTEPAAPGVPVFANAGELMAWVSEQQAAQRLTAQQVTASWATAKVGIADVMSPDTEKARAAIAAIVAVLHPQTVI